MEKCYSGLNTRIIECINPILNKWVVRWDFRKRKDENGEQIGLIYLEQLILHKPTILEVKDIVLNWMNGEIDKKLIGGYVWKDMPIWLSSENQFNYKAAYDLAVQTNGANLPIMFKFGTTEEPIYHEFKTVEDLTEFYLGAMNYINTTLNEGWAAKDSVDWSPYVTALSE